jgi:hypothetical protein
MRYGTALLAGLLGVMMVTAPVSAHHKEGHQGGPSKEVNSQSDAKKFDKDEKQNKHTENQENEGHGRGLHLGQLVNDLSGDEADDLADEFQKCTEADKLDDMHLGQIKRLAHAAGISTADLKDILSTNDSHATGFGVLVRNNLDDDSVINQLQEKLRNGLDSHDELDNLPPGKIIQAARACGLTPSDIVDILDGD